MIDIEDKNFLLKLGIFTAVLLPFVSLIWNNFFTRVILPFISFGILIVTIVFYILVILKNKKPVSHQEKMQKLEEELKEKELQLELEKKKAEIEKKKLEIKELNKKTSPNVLNNLSKVVGKTNIDLKKIKKLL